MGHSYWLNKKLNGQCLGRFGGRENAGKKKGELPEDSKEELHVGDEVASHEPHMVTHKNLEIG